VMPQAAAAAGVVLNVLKPGAGVARPLRPSACWRSAAAAAGAATAMVGSVDANKLLPAVTAIAVEAAAAATASAVMSTA
jgi:hypothetical protein